MTTMKIMIPIIAALAISILLPMPAAAETTCRRNAFGTMVCSNGSDYRTNSVGTIRETTPPRDADRRTNQLTECRTNAFGTLVCR